MTVPATLSDRGRSRRLTTVLSFHSARKRRSSDHSSTVGPPTRVNDTPPGDGTSQYLPAIAIAPNGRLDVLYYGRRADQANVMNEVSLQSSDDGGAHFGPSVRVSGRPFDSRIGFGRERNLPDLGSRLAVVANDQRDMGVWCDTRAGTDASGKQDLARAVVRFDPHPRGGPALRIPGFALAGLGLAITARWVVRRRRPEGDGASVVRAREERRYQAV